MLSRFYGDSGMKKNGEDKTRVLEGFCAWVSLSGGLGEDRGQWPEQVGGSHAMLCFLILAEV